MQIKVLPGGTLIWSLYAKDAKDPSCSGTGPCTKTGRAGAFSGSNPGSTSLLGGTYELFIENSATNCTLKLHSSGSNVYTFAGVGHAGGLETAPGVPWKGTWH